MIDGLELSYPASLADQEMLKQAFGALAWLAGPNPNDTNEM